MFPSRSGMIVEAAGNVASPLVGDDPVNAPPTRGDAMRSIGQHLIYTDDIPFERIPQSERDKSIGDPRGIVWIADGTRAYITGMDSNLTLVERNLEPFSIGRNGKFHHSLIAGEGSTQLHIKNPQLGNIQ